MTAFALKNNMADKVCTISGCEKRAVTKGMCAMHDARMRRHGDPHVNLRPHFSACQVKGCESTHRLKRGYCNAHYLKWYRHGDPSVGITRIAPTGNRVTDFWARVAITANDEKCWEWQGKVTRAGYGVFSDHCNAIYAHRLAYELATGIKPTLFILHSCDNPGCVNPKHLREGTPQENTRDAIERNRIARGERKRNAKLTENDVREIRRRIASGDARKRIAQEFGVHPTRIDYIKHKKNWAHVI